MLTADDAITSTRACMVLWGSCAAALGTSGAVFVKSRRRVTDLRLSTPMEEAKWSFSGSWATNITLVGGLLGTALASVELETPTEYLGGNVYVGFYVLFAIMTVMAPLVYVVLSKSAEPQGNVGGFLVAGGLTVWAVVGQIATLTLLLGEFAREGAYPPGSAWLLRGMLWGGMALVIGYCAKTMYAIITTQEPRAGVKVRLPL